MSLVLALVACGGGGICAGCGGGGDDGGPGDELPARFRGVATRIGPFTGGECITGETWDFRVEGANAGAPVVTNVGGPSADFAPTSCSDLIRSGENWTWACERPSSATTTFDFVIAADLSGGSMFNISTWGDPPQVACDYEFTVSDLIVEE